MELKLPNKKKPESFTFGFFKSNKQYYLRLKSEVDTNSFSLYTLTVYFPFANSALGDTNSQMFKFLFS